MIQEQELPGKWLSSPCDNGNGNLIMVSGREDVEKFRNNPRFIYRMSIKWDYSASSSSMPSQQVGELMAQAQDLLVDELHRDPIAVITGIYTGDGLKEWSLYTSSINILSRKLNEVWASLPLLPVTLEAFSDPDWDEYNEMINQIKD